MLYVYLNGLSKRLSVPFLHHFNDLQMLFYCLLQILTSTPVRVNITVRLEPEYSKEVLKARVLTFVYIHKMELVVPVGKFFR